LVIAAHPDDEIMGLGGTIARHVEVGDNVAILILGDGVTARYEDHELEAPEVQKQVATLKRNAMAAHRILGVRSTEICGLNCCRFDQISLLKITKIIENKIREIQPAVIYVHHHSDVNRDHQFIFKAAMSAIRPLKHFPATKVLCFEAPSSTDWIAPYPHMAFVPNYFVDITRTFKKKLLALQKYESEMREPPNPRSKEVLEAYAKAWGAKAGLPLAEAFSLVRMIER
jgi:LmbE family N-acetylglucosaminyl deacetylase